MWSKFLNLIKNTSKINILLACVGLEIVNKSTTLTLISLDSEIMDNLKKLPVKRDSTDYKGDDPIYRCIVAPIFEESIFRFIPHKLLPTSAYFFVSSVIFGSAHMINVVSRAGEYGEHIAKKLTIYQSVSAGVGGFLYGISYYRFGLLAVPILLHSLSNTTLIYLPNIYEYCKTKT